MKTSETSLKNICEFYAVTHKLKNILRSGQITWNIKAERFESVAEHIYGTQMLALVIILEFELGLNIEKVLLMLAVHELGEAVIGDLPDFDEKRGISKSEKQKREMNAVLEILKPLNDGNRILKIFEEFEAGETPESKFAHRVDKLECCFQIKFCEENGYNDFANPYEDEALEQLRQERISHGWTTLAKAWIEYDKQHCDFDKLFKDIADFLAETQVFVKGDKYE